MVGLSRTRTRIMLTFPPGRKTYDGGGATAVSVCTSPLKETCIDTIGNPKGENSLTVRKAGTQVLPRMNGHSLNVGAHKGVTYADWMPGATLSPPNHIAESLRTGHMLDAWTVIARMHPGEPLMELPVFLFELKDVPGMLKHAKGLFEGLQKRAKARNLKEVLRYLFSPKAVAEDWLAYNFGWRPLVSDLMAIGGLDDFIQQRRKNLKKAEENGFLSTRGKRGMREGRNSAGSGALNEPGFPVSCTFETTTWEKSWVSARWNLDRLRYAEALDGSFRPLLRDALGGDLALSQLWDAMPWSWLVDWFSSTGDIIHAKQNRQGVSLRSAMVMTHLNTVSVAHPLCFEPGIRLEGRHERVLDEKFRSPVNTANPLNGGINVFTPSHLATLASLSVTRARRFWSF